jgi:type III restriction enzyme
MDTQTWESTAAFKLEQPGVVKFYARNDHLGLVIPYEFMNVNHSYEPDFLVRLANDVTVLLEIKGYEGESITMAKHEAAKRWVTAVNNWGQLGMWKFHVCKNSQLLDREMAYLQQMHRGESPV